MFGEEIKRQEIRFRSKILRGKRKKIKSQKLCNLFRISVSKSMNSIFSEFYEIFLIGGIITLICNVTIVLNQKINVKCSTQYEADTLQDTIRLQ